MERICIYDPTEWLKTEKNYFIKTHNLYIMCCTLYGKIKEVNS